MTEQEYINITDLAKLRIAHAILHDCMSDNLEILKDDIYCAIRYLERKTSKIKFQK